MLMKSLPFFFTIVLISTVTRAQTPIDDLQKKNLNYLESQEREGYEFRSQIITEFDQTHASQDVNIKLSKDYTYIIVAMGDSSIPKIDLDIKPSKNAKMESLEPSQKTVGQYFQVVPTKSGRFKISINVAELQASQTGFISFMVLRK